MTVLLDGQYEWTSARGEVLLMGAGTMIRVTTVNGLLSQPPPKTNDQDLNGQHGISYGGEDFLGARVLDYAVGLEGSPGSSTVEALLDTFHTAFMQGIGEGTMRFKRPGKVQKQFSGKVRRSEFEANWDVRTGWAVGGLRIDCSDPRIYGDLLTTYATTIVTEAGGRTYNRVYPLVYGSTIANGSIIIVNAGNFDSPPIFRIYGPVTNPTILHVTQNKQLKFNIVLSASDVLEVDTRLHSVILNGTTSRRSTLDPTSRWWTIDRGNNELRFTASTGAGSHIEVDAQSAWATG